MSGTAPARLVFVFSPETTLAVYPPVKVWMLAASSLSIITIFSVFIFIVRLQTAR
jgi:hypothetical protein